MSMKFFEVICKNEELEGHYWRRYTNTFCPLAGDECHEEEKCGKVWANCEITKIRFLRKIFIQKFVPTAHNKFSLHPNTPNPPAG